MGGGLFILGLVIVGIGLIYITRKSNEESEFYAAARKIPVKFFFIVIVIIGVLVGYIASLERMQGLY